MTDFESLALRLLAAILRRVAAGGSYDRAIVQKEAALISEAEAERISVAG